MPFSANPRPALNSEKPKNSSRGQSVMPPYAAATALRLEAGLGSAGLSGALNCWSTRDQSMSSSL